jgi:serine/threonine-protein kinase
MNTSGPHHPQLPPEPSRQVQSLCAGFEADWLAGRSPRLEEFLAQVADGQRALLLRRLLAVDVAQRSRGGESPTAEDYRARLPGDAAVINDVFALLAVTRPETPLAPASPASTHADHSGGLTDSQRGTSAPRAVAAPGRVTGRAGRFEIEGEIARGGMGVVLRARDPDLKRPLVVKILGEQYRGDVRLLARFREEAQITGQLQHPGIPPVHEVGELPDGRPFFAMKLIQGRTLADLLNERTGPAEELPRFLGIFEQICQTLAYAHSKGVIHRDLKPQNIMVGAFGEVQVMDWGLAKALASRGAASRGGQVPQHDTATTSLATARTGAAEELSQAGDILGTPAYMAPEQARGEVEALDERSDVFGLGAILCVILTGSPPYSGSRSEIEKQAARGDLGEAEARLANCGADPPLLQLARACLAPEREARPGNAGLVAQAIGAYLAGVQERMRQAERQQAVAEARVLEERKRRRLAVALAGAVLLLVLAGGSGAWWFQQQRAAAQTRRDAATRQTLDALKGARAKLDTAWQKQDLGKLKEVKAEADRAVEIAETGAAAVAVQQDATAFQTLAAERVARAETNQRLLDALLDISAPRETGAYVGNPASRVTRVAARSLDEQYAAAFRAWGLEMDRAPVANGVARLRKEPEVVLQGILAGLDAWLVERRQRPDADWQRLLRVTTELDSNANRRQLRALLTTGPPQRELIVAGLTRGLLPWTRLWELQRGSHWRRSLELRGPVDPAAEPVLSVVLLARVCAGSGDLVGAEEVLRRAESARPDDVVLLDALARLLEQQGAARLAEAIEYYRAARALRPRLGIALAKVLLRAGRAGQAEAVIRDLLRREPLNPEMHFHLGHTLGEQQKARQAAAAYTEALRLRPNYPEAYNNLGVALRALGQSARAMAALRTALRQNPTFAEAHVNLAVGLRVQGKLGEAEAACREAIRLQPDLAEAHSNLGSILADQKNLSAALAAHKEAVRHRPDLPGVHVNLGGALQALGQHAEAETAFREAIRLKPDLAAAHSNLGLALAAQGKLEQAVAAYKEAIRLRPSFPSTHYNLGNALVRLGRLAKATASYAEAIRLKPDYGEAHMNRGSALTELGKFRQALDALRKAQELCARRPDWPAARAAALIRAVERFVELEPKLPAFLAGTRNPAGPLEQLEVGALCRHRARRLYAASARFYAAAFAGQPTLADDLGAAHRYGAACSAALAGCGRGEDVPRPGAEERARWRRQALTWLRADLAAWKQHLDSGNPQARAAAGRALTGWGQIPDLAGVRENEELTRLPEDERVAWRDLWADVALLRKQAAGK